VESLFDTVAGLPIHPLVVHFAVVLLPLAAVGVIASVFLPKIRSKYLGLSVLGVFFGTGAAFVAKQSGEALAERVGLPVRHADLGTYLLVASGIFFLISALWYWQGRSKTLSTTNPLGLLSSVAGIAVIGLSVITGHTGAEAVWQGMIVGALLMARSITSLRGSVAILVAPWSSTRSVAKMAALVSTDNIRGNDALLMNSHDS